MTKIKLYVSLKIPDKTAITTFHTLERMGYKELKGLERVDYYEFVVLNDVDKFMEDIVKTDILVNANKHDSEIFKAEDAPKAGDVISVLVKDSGDKSSSLFSTLRERMGFAHLESMTRGVLWKMEITGDHKKDVAEKITKELLYNEHYQEFELF